MRAEIKNVGQIRTILSLLAYAPPTLATIFDFELARKKVVSDSRGPLECVKIAFFEF